MAEVSSGPIHLRKRKFRNILLEGCILMAFWMLLSSMFNVFHILVGVLSVVLVLLLNNKIFRVQFFKGDVPEWERMRVGGLLGYIPWLLLEIVLASLQVAYVVLHPRMPIKPLLLKFTARLPNIGAKVMLANSITLTPGTITIEIRDDEFLVHALLDESTASLREGTMQTRVANIFRKSPSNIVSGVKIIRNVEEAGHV